MDSIKNNVAYKTIVNSTIIKLGIFIVFIFGLKDVIINIFIFFGVESANVYLYVSWIVFLLISMVILPSSNGLIT